MRKRKAYQPKPIRIPMTAGLRDTIALHMHASLAVLAVSPDVDSFDSLANIINMIGVAIDGNERFSHEFRLISGGALAMRQISSLVDASIPLQEHHIAPLRVAVTAIDCLLRWMDVSRIYTAEKLAVAAVREMRVHSARP